MKALVLCALALAAVTASADGTAIAAEAPAFALVNAADGQTVAMVPADGNTKVILFTSSQCADALAFEARIIELANKFAEQGVKFYIVEVPHPRATLDVMKARAVEKEYRFPYLHDADGTITRAYHALVTPHAFVVDGTGKVQYRGFIDNSAKVSERRTPALSHALGAIMNGRAVVDAETEAFGCAIAQQ